MTETSRQQILSTVLHLDVRENLQKNISGSYTNKDGQRVYTTDVVVEEQEFAESKSASESNAGFAPAERPAPSSAAGDGFMNIPDGIDEELPFN